MPLPAMSLPTAPPAHANARPPSPPAADLPRLEAAGLAERVDELRLQLVSKSVQRVPAVTLLSNLFSAWLLWRTGWQVAAPLWFVVMSGVHIGRWLLVRRWVAQPPATVAAGNRMLGVAVTAVGVLHALLVVGVFAGPHSVEPYLVTTHCAGVAAYAVMATGWRPRLLGWWIGMVGGALVVGWLFQGDLIGVAMALMTASMLATLLAQAVEQERAMGRMVTLAWDNEQLAASLRSERDRAHAAIEARTRFFAAASHDLRQPLHALSITAYALAMLARRQAQPKMAQLADNIERALRQSTGLLDGILDVSRLDAGAVKPDWRDIDLGPLLDNLGQEFGPLAAQRGLVLTVEHPETPLVVRSDPELLRRVLTNLLGNALKFTPSGSVRLQSRADGARVLLSVVDTGIGIAGADQLLVFEEFYQADNPARDRNQGLGLGLSIVRRIAVLLGVELRLDSAPGRGTRIDLRLPLGEPAALADAAPALAPAEPGAPLGLRVLVIDDEPDIRESMRSLLEQLGCEVATAEGQGDALAQVQAGLRPQAILTDHRLRDGNGLAALAALRAVLGDVPALVITGDTAPDTLAQIQASGHRALHKPVDGATLAQALRAVTNATGATSATSAGAAP